MASVQAKVDAAKAAVSSTSTCTPATVVTFKELLLPEPEPKAKQTVRAARTTATAKLKPGAAPKKTTGGELLGARERTVLATHVINAALKSLAGAAKPQPPATPSKHGDKLRQSAGRRSLRRSTSAPLSPLQPRTLNRVASSPNVSIKEARLLPPSQSTGCLATVECARVAFACLRSLKGPVQDGQADFQLENGMSALVGRLLALGLHDQALKELRILKRRLDGSTSTAARNTKATSAESGSAAVGVADLVEYGGNITKKSLATVTACQTQVLKLVAVTKKPAHVEALLPALQESNPSSPINLLSRLASAGDKEAAKTARQMASLSQIILSLVPSVSSAEDAVASEPRLSPDPTVVFQLQALAFRMQMRWWSLAGHQGSIDDEILSPFTRCMRAFVRRQKSDERLVYRTLTSGFEGIMEIVRSGNHQPATSSKSPLSSIYQVLGSTAHAARHYDDAYSWLQRLKGCLCTETDSFVRICSVSARILAAALKKSDLESDVEQLIGHVVAGLDGSLSGTVSELNELLEGLSAARRAVVGLLKIVLDPGSPAKPIPEHIVTVSKDFILRFPRFVRRWVGSPPGKDASTKQVLQFDQRRQTVMQSIGQVLDAALMVLKCDIQASSSEWQLMDDVLQHCAALLESISNPAMSAAKAEQLGVYHVKISSLYFSKFLELRKVPNRSRDINKRLLQALSRSIDAVKDRPLAEREKAQLSTKLELFADLCREMGRAEDAVRTLRSICTGMAEDGVLSDVAAALAKQPPALAWTMTEKASSLSRTLRSIAKLDRSCNDWTFFLPETERAAVLEHLVHLSAGSSYSPLQPLRLHDPGLAALLRIYAPDKYPVRRLRVLLHISYQNIGEEAGLDELESQLDQALQQLQRKDKAEDAALCHFIPHLEAYYALISAVADSETQLPISAVRSSISSWKIMTEACQTRDDLYAVIDNPEGLLDQLLSLNQLAGLKGDNTLQLSISELSITLAKAISGPSAAGSAGDSLVLSHSQLAARYVSIGSYTQAMETLEWTRSLVEQNEGISRGIVADFYLSQADYHTGIGAFEEALKCLSKANDICSQSYSTWAQSKSQATVTLSMASFLQSTVSLQKGDVQDALAAVKSSVRMLSHDWSKLEAEVVSANGASSAETSMSEASSASIQVRSSQSRASGPRFWRLASPLLRSLLHISSVYAHIGMFQETVYYAESARKVAENTQSPLFMAQVSAWMGSVYVKAGMRDKALAAHEEATKHMPQDACSCRVRVARQVGDFYNAMGNEEKAREYLKIAEDTIHQLSCIDQAAIASKGCEAGKGTAVTKTRSAAASKTPRATRTTRATRTPAAPRTSKRGQPAARAKTPPAPGIPEIPKDVYQSSLMAAVILSRAVGLIHLEDWSSALSTLEQLKGLPKLLGTLSQEQVVTATSLIGHSMEQMISDPVFSVVQDSTISFPAVCGGSDKGASDRAAASTSPARKGRSDRRVGKERGGPAFAEALRRAQELLVEAHGSALSGSDSGTVHRISTLLQSTIMLLSATSAAKARPGVSSSLATVAVDLGRNIAWTREQNTLKVPATTKTTGRAWSSRRCSLDLATDAAKFQKKYVEVIPKKWSVISLSLSDNRHDLCISKLQAGHSPFILRLPLERANCRDADSEVFNFEHGREELHAVIKLANETSHSARDFTAKGERSAWWSERAALDSRLRELLTTMETTWLGGFRGIFSQHQRRAELLARFQKSFQQILDGSLPSRNRMRGRKTAAVTLDPRILELFIGLGDPAEADNDYDESLNDLLYFVVDVLQFHGERNAYDEIDFDAMVVETYDALRGYHGAARSGGEREEGAHTVLVLDKALHEFPWESLPCMEGLAVSRVPSLACLRQLMMEQGDSDSHDDDDDDDDGQGQEQGQGRGRGRGQGRGQGPGQKGRYYVSAGSGTFILNPSADLDNTQAFFQGAFERRLASWTGLVRRAPSEAEMERALSTSDIVLYFGHGSGAQYIRGRTVRRLERCRAAAFLMGCSSAALTAAGEFECHGAVWNYMMAGSPAVVGTLWDVTDRDIDRFAGRAFEEWGLLPGGTFGPGHGGGGEERSLAEAVGRARGACRFRYLNAAAVVVYGIPVYLREGA
ncbi:peptidase family c50 domain-containing protein [Hirsutella rhossiliensis]|uniref:separase n=1 Tax=Hirsutella rhossiliensis TaxID=111463 RepID=A0A9P8N2I5_9HYPO|nr:peptidase family c50 domain-containing protein [Hirsutella rhossiliensis]KAH0963537.1 peptidase family c50 domain-containing protein [Hirsutella rhossiliensis]